jgi:hypothetical protein
MYNIYGMQELVSLPKAEAKEIAPLWMEKIEDGKLEPEKGLDLSLPNKCFVAEAHRFKDYDCDQCDLHATLIFFSSIIENTTKVSDLKYSVTPKVHEKIADFVEHWNAKHKVNK